MHNKQISQLFDLFCNEEATAIQCGFCDTVHIAKGVDIEKYFEEHIDGTTRTTLWPCKESISYGFILGFTIVETCRCSQLIEFIRDLATDGPKIAAIFGGNVVNPQPADPASV